MAWDVLTKFSAIIQVFNPPDQSILDSFYKAIFGNKISRDIFTIIEINDTPWDPEHYWLREDVKVLLNIQVTSRKLHTGYGY